MLLKTLQLGPMGNFTYIAGDPSAGLCAVIDPGWEAPAIEKAVSELGLRICAVILTHGHFDHSAAAEELVSAGDIPLWVHEGDFVMLPAGVKKKAMKDGGTIAVGNVEIKVLHTPGHSPGSCCLTAEDYIFTGDTLFIGECGRVDLPGSNPEQMRESLVKLSSLPEELRVLPGHAYPDSPESTIGAEKRHNRYMRLALKSREEFLESMMS